jgi:hypothetical protein
MLRTRIGCGIEEQHGWRRQLTIIGNGMPGIWPTRYYNIDFLIHCRDSLLSHPFVKHVIGDAAENPADLIAYGGSATGPFSSWPSAILSEDK